MKLCLAEKLDTPPTHCCARCGEPGAAIEWRTRWWCEVCHFVQADESEMAESSALAMVLRSERRIKVAKEDGDE